MEANIKDALEAAVDRMRPEIIESLQQLVRIPSVTGDEGQAQQFISELYTATGLETVSFEADFGKIKDHPAFCSSDKPYKGRPNIIGMWKGDPEKKSIVLNGHIDVVSPEPVAPWNHDPWGGEIEGNRLYGRGACDMKAGLIANLYAVKALMTCGVEPLGTVMLQSVIEEEAAGGGGTLACFIEGYTGDGMIVSEPLPHVNIALAGIRRFKIRIEGKPAHPAESQVGVNAIGKMLKIYQAIETLDAHRKATVRFPLFEESGNPAAHLIAGTFNAGDHISTVAGFAEMGCRIGFVPGEKEADIQRLVETTVREAADQDDWLRKHPPAVEWLSFRCEPYHQDPAHPFVQTVLSAVNEVLGGGSNMKPRGNTWSEDTRYAQHFGFPAVSLGPSGMRAHGIDECVDLDALVLSTKEIAYAALKWCSQDR
jgi:acetylornithine deacetylase